MGNAETTLPRPSATPHVRELLARELLELERACSALAEQSRAEHATAYAEARRVLQPTAEASRRAANRAHNALVATGDALRALALQDAEHPVLVELRQLTPANPTGACCRYARGLACQYPRSYGCPLHGHRCTGSHS